MDSKIKTGLSETTLRKSSPGSLSVPKLSRSIMTSRSEPNSPTPTRSPANRSRKVPTPPEKTRTRSVIGSSESQPRLSQLKEDLRKANELIASLESEKAKALAEAYEQIREALEAQKMAEIEKFKAVEAGVEAVQRKEEELEIVKNQHASDSSLLLIVTRELARVTQELVDSNDAKSKLLTQSENASKMIAIHAEKVDILSSELAVLKSVLEKARSFEAEEVKKRDMILKKLDTDIKVLKMERSSAHGSADQWCNKARELEEHLEEANMKNRSVSASILSWKKQLKVTKEEAEKLKKELETVKEEKKQGLKREEGATSSIHILMKERKKILSELERSKEEEEKSKKAMESLASALREVSCEASEMKEKLLSLGSQDYETHVEDLKLVIKETNEKYEKMLHEVEQTKKKFESSKVDWEMREAGLVNHVKKFDEEVSSMGKEINRLGNLVKKTKEEADGALKRESEMRDDLKEVEDELSYLQETLREGRAESLKLNAKMLDKETEFQSVIHENDLLRVKQDDSVKKINELSKLLEEALAKKDTEDDNEQDYDLLFRSAEEEYREEKEDSTDGNDDDDDDVVEVGYSMCESYHTEKKDFHKGK